MLGRLLDGRAASRPAELVKDGDLIQRMLHLRVLDTVRISEVNGADEAADFGRRRVPWWIFDARRNYSWCVLVGARLSSACIGL